MLPVSVAAFHAPFAAVNVGLESFAASLESQGAEVISVDWRPPAGGDERLMALLAKMK
jgi:FdrA protein